MAAPQKLHSRSHSPGTAVATRGIATFASTFHARAAEPGSSSVRASSSPAYCPALDFNPPLPGPVMTFEQRRSGAKLCVTPNVSNSTPNISGRE